MAANNISSIIDANIDLRKQSTYAVWVIWSMLANFRASGAQGRRVPGGPDDRYICELNRILRRDAGLKQLIDHHRNCLQCLASLEQGA